MGDSRLFTNRILVMFFVVFTISILGFSTVAPAALAGNTLNEHTNSKSVFAGGGGLFIFASDNKDTSKGQPATKSVFFFIFGPGCFVFRDGVSGDEFQWSQNHASINIPDCGGINVEFEGEGPVEKEKTTFGTCDDAFGQFKFNGMSRTATASGSVGANAVNDLPGSINHGVVNFQECE